MCLFWAKIQNFALKPYNFWRNLTDFVWGLGQEVDYVLWIKNAIKIGFEKCWEEKILEPAFFSTHILAKFRKRFNCFYYSLRLLIFWNNSFIFHKKPPKLIITWRICSMPEHTSLMNKTTDFHPKSIDLAVLSLLFY